MRFDDLLDTVLSGDRSTSFGAQAAWRQVVDLIGRGRSPADARALSVLSCILPSVPAPVRAASARALIGARPPFALVRMLVTDTHEVAAPLLRELDLSAADWIALLPELSPGARAILRHRRDLVPEVVRALASFGSADFVIPGGTIAHATPAAAMAPTAPAPMQQRVDAGPFQTGGAVARALPIVNAAIRHVGSELDEPNDVFRIADVVARIEAYQKQQGARAPLPPPSPRPERLTFETDAAGTIRWVEGVPRGAVIGVALTRTAVPGEAGVDGVAAGAFRKRTRFHDARLVVGGEEDATGLWLISAVPAFNRADGRFTGYRGSGRRPRADEMPHRRPSADVLRQLVHELRTPTNAIAGFAEMIEHGMLGPVPEVYRNQACTIRRDARGLLGVIDDLDLAARLEGGALQRYPQPTAIAPLLGRIVEELAPLGEVRGAELALDVVDVTIESDARALERLIARLAATMLGAGAAGERIAMIVEPWERGIRLAIDRPAALVGRDESALFAHDDEGAAGGSLLGVGFALRLVRNLARELGGSLAVGEHALTLRLPAMLNADMGRAQES